MMILTNSAREGRTNQERLKGKAITPSKTRRAIVSTGAKASEFAEEQKINPTEQIAWKIEQNQSKHDGKHKAPPHIQPPFDLKLEFIGAKIAFLALGRQSNPAHGLANQQPEPLKHA